MQFRVMNRLTKEPFARNKAIVNAAWRHETPGPRGIKALTFDASTVAAGIRKLQTLIAPEDGRPTYGRSNLADFKTGD